MNKEKLSLHVQMFNDKVRAMNQTNSRDLVLSAQEARNLHSDIFNLLAKLAELETNKPAVQLDTRNNSSNFDGGSF